LVQLTEASVKRVALNVW